jgi:hypothetical protein
LAQIWGIRPGARVWVGGHNLAAKQEIERHLTGTDRPSTGPLDIALIAPLTSDEALYFAGKLRSRLTAAGGVWIIYPNARAAGGEAFARQLDEMVIGMFERGFGEAGRGAVSEHFSTLGFRPDSDSSQFLLSG